MVTPAVPPLHRDCDFNGPLSDAHSARLIDTLGDLDGKHVVDVGCGWAELLLRTLERAPTATGFGIDIGEASIAHGRANARKRGLADRVELAVGDAGEWTRERAGDGTGERTAAEGRPLRAVAGDGRADADVVFNIGSTHAWGGDPVVHTTNALEALSGLLRPGGLLLFGEGFWTREPTDAELAAMYDTPREQYRTMRGLVDLALSYGFRLRALSQASLEEWDDFENRHAKGWEEWLLENPDSPDAEEVRTRADRQRVARVDGWREVMGMAYLTLIRV